MGLKRCKSCGEGACCEMMKKVEDKVTSFALWFFFLFLGSCQGFLYNRTSEFGWAFSRRIRCLCGSCNDVISPTDFFFFLNGPGFMFNADGMILTCQLHNYFSNYLIL